MGTLRNSKGNISIHHQFETTWRRWRRRKATTRDSPANGSHINKTEYHSVQTSGKNYDFKELYVALKRPKEPKEP